jgi:hypothetical protein
VCVFAGVRGRGCAQASVSDPDVIRSVDPDQDSESGSGQE